MVTGPRKGQALGKVSPRGPRRGQCLGWRRSGGGLDGASHASRRSPEATCC